MSLLESIMAKARKFTRSRSLPIRVTIDIGSHRWEIALIHERIIEDIPTPLLTKVTSAAKMSIPDDPQDGAVYCGVCGKELMGRIEPAGFNPQTGAAIMVAFAVCPDLHYVPGDVNVHWEGRRFFCHEL